MFIFFEWTPARTIMIAMVTLLPIDDKDDSYLISYN